MNYIIVFCAIIGLSTQYGHKPEPQHQPEPEWDNHWEHKPKPEWSPPEPEWSTPEWKPIPKPEHRCKVIPKHAKTIEYTPIAEPEISTASLLFCDPGSVIQQLAYESKGQSAITCNGVIVVKTDDKYSALFNSHGNHGKHWDVLNLCNYTQIEQYLNGNLEYLECGTIKGGKCDGDTFWGNGYWKANDQFGCCKNGITSLTSIYREIWVKGKCASRCTLGSSLRQIWPAVNNEGLTDRTHTVDVDKRDEEREPLSGINSNNSILYYDD